MPRYRQTKNPETGKYEFIPIDAAARQRDGLAAVHGDIEPFVSPVDGSVISDRKQLREHNRRNNVVCSEEISQAYYKEKAEERRQFFAGEHSKSETRRRKMELYETLMRAERGLPT